MKQILVLIFLGYSISSLAKKPSNEEHKYECAKLALQRTDGHYRSLHKNAKRFEGLANATLSFKGIKPIAQILPGPPYISKQYDKEYFEHLTRSGEMQEAKADFAKVVAANEAFVRKSAKLIEKDRPQLMSECLSILKNILHACDKFKSDPAMAKRCREYEAAKNKDKLAEILPVAKLVDELERAEKLDKKIAKAAKQDDPKQLQNAIEKRIDVKGVHLPAIMPFALYHMVKNSARKSLALLQSFSDKMRAMEYAKFKTPKVLMRLAIDNNSLSYLEFFCEDPKYGKFDLKEMKSYAKRREKSAALKVLKKSCSD